MNSREFYEIMGSPVRPVRPCFVRDYIRETLANDWSWIERHATGQVRPGHQIYLKTFLQLPGAGAVLSNTVRRGLSRLLERAGY